jgi:hypothetical protein
VKSSGTVLKKYGGVFTTDIWNELDTAASESLTVTVIKYMPTSVIRVGAMATVDQVGKVRIPAGRVRTVAPAKELVAVIVKGFPSSSTNRAERS